MKHALMCIVGLLAGILIGRLLPRASPETAGMDHKNTIPTQSKPQRPGDIPTPTANAPISGSAGPRGETAVGKPETEPGMVKVPAALIRELSLAAGDRRPDGNLFSRDGRIEEVLGITDHEKAVIQTAWSSARQRLRDAEIAAMKTEEIDEWSVRITVPDLSRSLQTLGGEFRASVESALGKDRGEAFLAAKQVDRVFTPREGEQSYTVTTEEIGDGKWRFRFTVDGPAGQRVWVGESIPDEIRHLTDAARVNPSLGE